MNPISANSDAIAKVDLSMLFLETGDEKKAMQLQENKSVVI